MPSWSSYNAASAERDANSHPANRTHVRNHLRVFRGMCMVLLPVQLSGSPPYRFYEVYSDDERAIFGSPLHSTLPCSHARTQLPDHTPWRPTRGSGRDGRKSRPTRSPSLRTSIARSNSCPSSGNGRTGDGKAQKVRLVICPGLGILC